MGSSERLGGDADRQGLVTLHEAGIHPLRLADHLNIVVPLEDFFPDDLELKLCKPDSDAAMDAETEGDVGARPRAINDEFVGAIDHVFVAVARDVPHHDLVTLLDLPAAELDVFKRGAAHMRQRRLPADHLW